MKKDPFNYKRILLKLSGEALAGDRDYGIDPNTANKFADEIKMLVDSGIKVCVVIGGGNIYRGIEASTHGIEKASADYMGMLATVINALALQNSLEKKNIVTRVQSAIPMDSICEPYIRRRALRHMEKGRVVLFAAGIGNPFFTTDTAASLRAVEMGCDALFKGTNSDGIYDSDPKYNPNAVRLESVTYQTVLEKNLGFMDASAISLARESNIPIIIFPIGRQGEILRVLRGDGIYSIVKDNIQS